MAHKKGFVEKSKTYVEYVRGGIACVCPAPPLKLSTWKMSGEKCTTTVSSPPTIKLTPSNLLPPGLPLAPSLLPKSHPLLSSLLLSTLYIYSTMKFTLAIGALLAASATAFAPNAALTRAVVASSSSSSALE